MDIEKIREFILILKFSIYFSLLKKKKKQECLFIMNLIMKKGYQKEKKLKGKWKSK